MILYHVTFWAFTKVAVYFVVLKKLESDVKDHAALRFTYMCKDLDNLSTYVYAVEQA